MGALYEAVRGGDLAAVKKALKGSFIDESGDDGMTPLILAAKSGRADLVKVLLDGGADVQMKDAMHESAILKAGAEGHHQVVAMLAPRSTPEDVDQAKAFLSTFGKTHGPMKEDLEAGDKFMRKVAEVAANASAFFGDEDPKSRMERVERSEENDKKNRR
jgi:uncharacterized protein